jgi:ABC-type nickel/cobalt efflux system permease component RcnA
MDPELGALWTEAVKQAPALAVLAFVVVWFWRNLREILREHATERAEHLRSLREIAQRNAEECKLHAQQLTEIGDRHERNLGQLVDRYDVSIRTVIDRMAEMGSRSPHKPPPMV